MDFPVLIAHEQHLKRPLQFYQGLPIDLFHQECHDCRLDDLPMHLQILFVALLVWFIEELEIEDL